MSMFLLVFSAPSKPTRLAFHVQAATVGSPPRATLTWAKPAQENGVITSYDISYSEDTVNPGEVEKETLGSSVFSWSFVVLGGTTYSIAVSASTIKLGPNSTTTFTVLEYGESIQVMSIENSIGCCYPPEVFSASQRRLSLRHLNPVIGTPLFVVPVPVQEVLTLIIFFQSSLQSTCVVNPWNAALKWKQLIGDPSRAPYMTNVLACVNKQDSVSVDFLVRVDSGAAGETLRPPRERGNDYLLLITEPSVERMFFYNRRKISPTVTIPSAVREGKLVVVKKSLNAIHLLSASYEHPLDSATALPTGDRGYNERGIQLYSSPCFPAIISFASCVTFVAVVDFLDDCVNVFPSSQFCSIWPHGGGGERHHVERVVATTSTKSEQRGDHRLRSVLRIHKPETATQGRFESRCSSEDQQNLDTLNRVGLL